MMFLDILRMLFPLLSMSILGFAFTDDNGGKQDSGDGTDSGKRSGDAGDSGKKSQDTDTSKSGTGTDSDKGKSGLDFKDIPQEAFQKIFDLGFGKAKEKFDTWMQGKLTEMGVSDEKLKVWNDLEKAKQQADKEKAEAEKKVLEAKGEYEKLTQLEFQKREEIEKSHKEQLKAKDAAVKNAETFISDLLIKNEIMAAAQTGEKKAVNPVQVIALTQNMFKVKKEQADGKTDYKVNAYDENGNPLFNQEGNAMSVKEAIQKFLSKPENANLVSSKVADGGSGSKGQEGFQGQKTKIETSRDAISAGLKKRGIFK